jgi:predicted DNA-binding protein
MDDMAWIRRIFFERELLYCGDPKIMRMMQHKIKRRLREIWKEIEERQSGILMRGRELDPWFSQKSLEYLRSQAIKYEAYLNDETLNEKIDYILRLIDGLPERQQRMLFERLGIQVELDASAKPIPATKRVQLRLSLFEYQRLKAFASATGFTLSQILRQSLLETTVETNIQWELRRSTAKVKLEKKVWVRLPTSLMDRATKLARSYRVPTSTFIRGALRHYLEKQSDLYKPRNF